MNRSRSLRAFDSSDGAMSKSFPARPPGRPGRKQSDSSPVSSMKQALPWAPARLQTLLPRRSSVGSTNNTSAGSIRDGRGKEMNKLSTAELAPAFSVPGAGGNTSLSRASSNRSCKDSADSTSSSQYTVATMMKNNNKNTRNDLSRHMNSERTASRSSRRDGAMIACGVEKDGTVFLRAGAAAQPLQLELTPASRGSKLTGEEITPGAVLHSLRSSGGGGDGEDKVDALVQKLVKQGDILVEVNGQDVRNMHFSKILALFGAEGSQLTANNTDKTTSTDDENSTATAPTSTGSSSTSTTSSPRSSVNAPLSPTERRGETREFREPLVEMRTPNRAARYSGSSAGSSKRSRFGLTVSAQSCPPSPAPAVVSNLITPKASGKRHWSRLSPFSKGWGGGTPGKSPRLGWLSGARVISGRSRSSTPSRVRASTFSSVGAAVLEKDDDEDDDDDTMMTPFALPSPGGDCFPEVPGPVGGILAPPSPGGDTFPEDEDEPPSLTQGAASSRAVKISASPVTVSAAPMITLRFSTPGVEVPSGGSSGGGGKRVGFSPDRPKDIGEEAARKGFVRREDSGEGRLAWISEEPADPGTAATGVRGNRERSATFDGAGDPVTAVGCVEEFDDVVSESERQRLAEAAAVDLREYFSLGDRGWPWSGKEVIWADYVNLSRHHRWIRSEGCRHAFLVVSDALYILEVPTDAVTSAINQSRRAKRNASSTVSEAGKVTMQAPFQPSGGRGWLLKISATALKFITIPLTPRDVAVEDDTKENANKSPMGAGGRQSAVTFVKNGGKVVKVGGRGVKVAVAGEAAENPDRAGTGLILHGRGWACAWLECANVHGRNCLVEVVSAWHHAVTSGSELKVDRLPHADASAKARGGNGATMTSMLTERQSCSW